MRRVGVQTLDRQRRMTILLLFLCAFSVMIARHTRLQRRGPAPFRHGVSILVRQQQPPFVAVGLVRLHHFLKCFWMVLLIGTTQSFLQCPAKAFHFQFRDPVVQQWMCQPIRRGKWFN